jgi:hypothetical protein
MIHKIWVWCKEFTINDGKASKGKGANHDPDVLAMCRMCPWQFHLENVPTDANRLQMVAACCGTLSRL